MAFRGRVRGFGDVREMLQHLRREAPAANARVVNRGLAAGLTRAVREVARALAVLSRDVRAAFALRRATPARAEAAIVAVDKRIGLVKAGARGPEPSRGRGRVTVRAGQVPPSAFLATTRSGHRAVWVRRGVSRSRAGLPPSSPALPIQEVHTEAVPSVFVRMVEPVLARITEALVTTARHEYQRLLARR
jgi:hypothetical protein